MPLILLSSISNSIRMEALLAHLWLRHCATCTRIVVLALAVGLSQSSQGKESTDGALDSAFDDSAESEVLSPDAAKFDQWESLFEENDVAVDNTARWNDPSVKTIDWMRHFGFRHSSSEGRYAHKGVPLEGTSWLNRPYHADWFVGSLLGDELIAGRVDQNNELIGGVRIGFDFDYYWGLEWRFGWSHPDSGVISEFDSLQNGTYFISDIDLKYYPWGDTVVRPYWLLGLGMASISFRDDTEVGRDVTLATMPFGTGVEFHQWPWLVWRFEVLDNLAFGADGVETLNNFSLTAGMEYRFGAKPQSYWPWRSSRRIW